MDGGNFKETLSGLMATQEGHKTVEAAMPVTLQHLLNGKGRAEPDGSFNGKAPTFGESFEPKNDAHRAACIGLLANTAYMQGTAFAFRYLDEETGVLPGLQDDPDYEKLFGEAHWNRSQMLLNTFYKGEADCGPGYMTLSQITEVSLKNETRNRDSIKNRVFPVFGRFGIWSMSNGKGKGTQRFTPGPFLIMFHEQVFTPFTNQKRDG